MSRLTHNADDQFPIERFDCNPEEEESNRNLDQTNGEEEDGLCDKIEFEGIAEVCRVDIIDMSSSP